MESWSSAEADEEWSDARRLSKEETLHLIEGRVLELLRSVKQGENPSMTLVRLGYIALTSQCTLHVVFAG